MRTRTHEKKKNAIAKRWWIEVVEILVPDLPRRLADKPNVKVLMFMRPDHPVQIQPASQMSIQFKASSACSSLTHWSRTAASPITIFSIREVRLAKFSPNDQLRTQYPDAQAVCRSGGSSTPLTNQEPTYCASDVPLRQSCRRASVDNTSQQLH
jgi:hypothetical protein